MENLLAAKRALLGGSAVVTGTIPVSMNRIRIIQIKRKEKEYFGKWIQDGKWYLIYKVEIEGQ